MMFDEINGLISSVLELYKKRRVDGDTPEVSRLADELMAFAARHSLEDEMRQLREEHLPTRSNQIMTIGDANAIIKCLLSLQSRFVEAPVGINALVMSQSLVRSMSEKAEEMPVDAACNGILERDWRPKAA